MTAKRPWWRDHRAKNLLWIIAILFLFFGVRAWQQHTLPKGQAPQVTGSLTRNGETVSLSDFQGRPVMLYFWASWCRICEFEQGSIQSIAKDHQVLGIAIRSGNALQLEKYMAEHAFNIDTISDEYGEISSRYGIRGTPTAFFIDSKGEIRSVEVGYTSEFGMRLRMWLAGI